MMQLKTVQDLVSEGIISFDAAIEARKDAETYIRKPRPEEIGTTFITYVEKEDGMVVIESKKTITQDSYIWRNLTPFSDGIRYNEWVNTKETLNKNYGDVNPDYEFRLYKKINTIKAIKVTKKIAEAMGCNESGYFSLLASWGGEVKGRIGDYLVESGYILDKREFQKAYIIIRQRRDLIRFLRSAKHKMPHRDKSN